MKRKFVALFTVLAVLNLSFACVIHRSQKIRHAEIIDEASGDVVVLAVLKTSGEHIEFPKDQPGRIIGNSVVGGESKKLEIDLLPSRIVKTSRLKEAIRSLLESSEIRELPINLLIYKLFSLFRISNIFFDFNFLSLILFKINIFSVILSLEQKILEFPISIS